jgi:hypothetical protein
LAAEVGISWPEAAVRPWAGADIWANPAEDWMIQSGRAENRFAGGNRNLAVLTAELSAKPAPFVVRCRIDQTSIAMPGPGFAGLQVGLAAPSGDYREAAVYGSGLCAGLRTDGTLFIDRTAGTGEKIPAPFRTVTLELKGEPTGTDQYRLILAAIGSSGLATASVSAEVHASWLQGLVAFTASSVAPPAIDVKAPRPKAGAPAMAQTRGGTLRIAFDRLLITGEKVEHHPERAFGPIYWVTQSSSNDGSLCLLVQAAPFGHAEKLDASLVLDGKPHASTQLDPESRTARFVMRRQNVGVPHEYEIKLAGESFKGIIRPIPKGRVTVAALSCDDSTGFPHADLVANVTAHKPDLIAFLGDQVYEGVGGYGSLVDQRRNERTILCYLRKYALHGWIWRDVLRDTPSVTLPDDHDVFHGNLWGADGKKADVSAGYGNDAQDSGGYKMSPEFVNVVHATQTRNLPEPVDPLPCNNMISVYFTQWLYGPLDLAIIADRQFKSAPRDLLPEGRIANGWPKSQSFYLAPPPDHPQAQLLGRRQEEFLQRWAAKPTTGSPIRMVLSQSPWAAPHTLPADVMSDAGIPDMTVPKPGEYPPDDQPKPDFDTNGWPQGKRKLALEFLKQAGALHVTGDQHLGSTGQYGLAAFRDGPWWVSTPATANLWPRRWMPAAKGGNPRPGDPRETGDFTDGFGNKLTIAAVANPFDIGREPGRLFDRAVGYTILTCDPATGHVTIANWPYWAAPGKPAPDDLPYPGWPITINPKTRARL